MAKPLSARVSLSSPQLGSIPSRHCQSGGRSAWHQSSLCRLPTGTISAPNHFMTTTQTEGRPRTSSRPSGKNHLSMDRLSCHRFLANQFRLLLHALAYQMFVRLRDYLHGTPSCAQARNRNLTSSGPGKIGARIRQTTRRHLGPSFLSLPRTTPLPPRLESPGNSS